MPPPRSFTAQMQQDPPKGTVALEEAFIMRFPPEVASKVRHLLKNDQIDNRLSISMDSYHRRAEVILKEDPNQPAGVASGSKDVILKGKLVDLPTISEIHKSLDNKNMYKCADLHQLLILQHKDEYELKEKIYDGEQKEDNFDMNDVNEQINRDQMFAYPHGLCPPFRNARKHRFRKRAKRKNINSAELEKEVKDLLRKDIQSRETSYIIETEEIDKNYIRYKNKMRKKHAYTLDGDYARVYGEECQKDPLNQKVLDEFERAANGGKLSIENDTLLDSDATTRDGGAMDSSTDVMSEAGSIRSQDKINEAITKNINSKNSDPKLSIPIYNSTLDQQAKSKYQPDPLEPLDSIHNTKVGGPLSVGSFSNSSQNYESATSPESKVSIASSISTSAAGNYDNVPSIKLSQSTDNLQSSSQATTIDNNNYSLANAKAEDLFGAMSDSDSSELSENETEDDQKKRLTELILAIGKKTNELKEIEEIHAKDVNDERFDRHTKFQVVNRLTEELQSLEKQRKTLSDMIQNQK